MLNRSWLRSFITLVEQGSFTRAADTLDVTQAAVSQHIRRIEDEVGRILIRRPRAIELTPAGKALLAYARELDHADHRLEVSLADAGALSGEVSLITPGSVGLLLYPMLLDIQAEQSGLSIRHRFAPDPEIVSAVLENRFEFGLATLRPDDPRLSATPFSEEALELVVPAGQDAKDWTDLERLGFIDHPDGQAMANRLLGLRFPHNPGVRSLPVRGFTNQVGLILEPVARGFGFTVIPRYARQAFARADRIRVVEGRKPVVDTLWLLRRAEWPLTARAQRVVEQLRDRVGAMGGPSASAGSQAARVTPVGQ